MIGGAPVIKEAQVQDACWDGILITSLEGIEEAEAQLVQLGVSEDAIWTLS